MHLGNVLKCFPKCVARIYHELVLNVLLLVPFSVNSEQFFMKWPVCLHS